MKLKLESLLKKVAPVADILLTPFVYLSAVLLLIIRITGVHRFPYCKKALLKVGVFPIRNHYYEPLFDPRNLRKSLRINRDLPGIDWNVNEQIDVLDRFHYNDELSDISSVKTDDQSFYWDNGAFGSGDAEYWYNIIRSIKPRLIIEVGCGHSTRMAIKAIRRNRHENPEYICKHICIEPYENPWLESLGVLVIREKVENTDKGIFKALEENDILFIDSSHMIRPQGDVLFEYLEILPILNKGVIVHIHDIFSPKDYLDEWIINEACFWNEQYLLEAFLTSNESWKIIGALNYLHHNHYDKLKEKCHKLTPDREPGSFYIKKTQ
jgi:hypothetical protein